MNGKASFFAELRRRNVLRAAVLYAGAVWLLAQVITQLGPVFHAPEWIARGFLIAAVFGFPFWIAFAWFYALTPLGFKRESEVAPGEPIRHSTTRKLDFAIIGVLAVAVVLLLTDRFVLRKDASSNAPIVSSIAIPQKSIAVLPLANESGDKSEQYFSDGLSEDLITALSQFAGLKVISRNSSFQYRNTTENSKTIGEKLGVAHLLEGSVRHVGGMVRISATLVNAADGSTLWSQHYDRSYTDLFALQDDITHAVAGALKAKLLAGHGAVPQSDRPRSGNLDAWTAFSRAQLHANASTLDDWRKAITFYEQAIALDPHYARAYAGMSGTWTNLGGTFLGGEEQRQAFAKARTAVNQALLLDPDLAAAHRAHALLLQWVDFDWAGAQAEYRRALELAPNDGHAMFGQALLLSALGRPEQALPLFRQAIAIDPGSSNSYYWLAWGLAATGQLDEAEQAMREAVARVRDGSFSSTGLTILLVRRGDAKGAMASAQQEPPGVWRDIALAMASQIGADRAAADAALKDLIATNADSAAYQIAEVYGLRKDPDNMFKWLDRAWDTRDSGIQRLLTDPFILPYQDDPRFAAFRAKVGLSAPSQADP